MTGGAATGRPTIRDVARRSGVSVATVSRVLNGTAPVAPETKRRVQEAVAALDFISSASARTLRPGTRSRAWALLVDDVDSPYFAELAEKLDRAAQDHGSTLIIGATHKLYQRERELVREMASRRVDGLLIAAASGGDRRGSNVTDPPTVFIDRIPTGVVADVVTFDHYAAVVDQVNAFLERDRRRIGFLGGIVAEDPGSRRYAAYADALRLRGLPLDESIISVLHDDEQSAYTATRELLAQPDPPTALVITTAQLLLGALRAVHDHPADVELSASEDLRGSFLTPVPLLVSTPAVSDLADRAASLLSARIAGQRSTVPESIVLPVAQQRRR